MLAPSFANYNLCRPHRIWTAITGYQQKPAMAAGLETEFWTQRRFVEESSPSPGQHRE